MDACLFLDLAVVTFSAIEFAVRQLIADLTGKSWQAELKANANSILLSYLRHANMTTLTETELTRLSTEDGESFADAYYTALNASRAQITSFYVPSSTSPRPLPHISFNGELLNDASTLQERFEKDMPYTHFEPQSANVHVMNPSIGHIIGNSKRDAEANVSLVVQISGYVRLQERKEGPMKGFSDSFVLVPNKEETGGKGAGKQSAGRKWLIQTQNFRFVV